MPYKSQKQSAFMHAKHPEIAKKWDKEMKAKGEHTPKRAYVEHHSPGKRVEKAVPMKHGSDKLPRDVGAAKGKSNVGGHDSSHLNSAKEQTIGKKGPSKQKMQPQISPEDGDSEALAARGMSSEAGARHWKATGYKVPTGQEGHHFPGKVTKAPPDPGYSK